MIGHNQALNAVETIMYYCQERFKGNERECNNCIFHNRRCMLYNLLGMYGKDVSKIAYETVKANYEVLQCNEKR